MNSNIKIAKEEELIRVYSLCKEIKENYEFWDEYYPLYDNFLETFENGFVLYYEENGEILGSLSIDYDIEELAGYDDAMSFNKFMVKESHRGKGIGKKLFDYAEKLVIKEGYNKIVFLVNDGNKKALSLYLYWGYQDKGIIDINWDEEISETFHIYEKVIK